MSDQVTNLQSAVNSLQNADIGATVANMTQYNVLESTGMAALQQANQAQQAVRNWSSKLTRQATHHGRWRR